MQFPHNFFIESSSSHQRLNHHTQYRSTTPSLTLLFTLDLRSISTSCSTSYSLSKVNLWRSTDFFVSFQVPNYTWEGLVCELDGSHCTEHYVGSIWITPCCTRRLSSASHYSNKPIKVSRYFTMLRFHIQSSNCHKHCQSSCHPSRQLGIWVLAFFLTLYLCIQGVLVNEKIVLKLLLSVKWW